MANSALRGEIIEKAKQWPTSLRARLDRGVWQLLGADKHVCQEFGSCAARLVRELGLPLVDCDPIEALLHRLKENGRHVRRSERAKEYRVGSAKIVTREAATVISPLRDALVEYLDNGPGLAPLGKLKSKARAQNTGQADAATKNRQREARLRIIRAFARLGIPFNEWPDFVRAYYTDPHERTEYHQTMSPELFQPPEFDRLNQSPEDWVKIADRAWELHRNRVLEACEYGVKVGMDDEIPAAKRARGPGKTGRRLNAPPDLRFEWAASRLRGAAWKQIAGESFKENQVMKAATEVLESAGWPPEPKANKPGTPLAKPSRIPGAEVPPSNPLPSCITQSREPRSEKVEPHASGRFKKRK